MLRSLGDLSRLTSRAWKSPKYVSKGAYVRHCSSLEPREAMEYDCVIVGAGPAGLSAAIRLKQLALENDTEVNVCIVDKGAEVGAHILSGNVFEPRALNELFPDWANMDNPPPLDTETTDDEFLVLTGDKSSLSIPHLFHPPQLNNKGNYVLSLSQLARWLGEQAEELGVEIYPGFAADEVIYNEQGEVKGIATKDVGIAKTGEHKDTFTRGIELHAKHTLFAEGCRGSCSEELIAKFKLREGKDEQTYGLGVKEVWEVPEENFKAGYVQHTLGWPLQTTGGASDPFGGTFLYHQKPNLVLVGMVVGLDYKNPYLSPYKEFQRWKHHPAVAKHLKGGECISYGARTLNEGGWHAIPTLTFPGGSLIGCSAGFLNAVKIKGSHTAMKSGMLAAEALFPHYASNATEGEEGDIKAITMPEYETNLRSSWIADELKTVRNTHAAFHWGTLAGMIHTALSCFITGGSEPWTLSNTKKDSDQTLPASECKEIVYPKPDGVLSFDLLTNLQRSGTSHDHDQPAHLRIKPECSNIPKDISLQKYAGPESRFCPAQVYEYTEDESGNGNKNLVINAQNCLHCKACSIKTPSEYIKWTVPEGGGGPAYTVM